MRVTIIELSIEDEYRLVNWFSFSFFSPWAERAHTLHVIIIGGNHQTQMDNG